MSDLTACGIVCPTDWVPLPIDPSDDVKSWAKSTAKALRDRSKAAGHGVDGRALRDDLRARAEDSRSREPFYAFAFYPDGFDTALAVLEVDLIHPDATVPRITLDWLADTFSAHDFGLPRIAHAELPIGPAVRLRQNFALDAPSAAPTGTPLRTVTYGVLPTGADSAVMLLVSWTVPGLDEEMEEAADSIVRTLTVEISISPDGGQIPGEHDGDHSRR
ncbi:hypothetical protein DI272_27110 [Streptomyces sp. Act143]|uniref:hypothetical protein n=1 Tax=Streptomyces sp. Act143 TaxID=2200760 RepID=UPI000D67ED14|nr:hypothetical protein [Streptomyces sp. Act143]PWI17421.1 hypothetical protein DI272_27110 [Streptomyces sp. Act143]